MRLAAYKYEASCLKTNPTGLAGGVLCAPLAGAVAPRGA